MRVGAKPETRVDALLYELCVVYGFCLPPDERDALIDEPPGDADSWVHAVLVAEGMDPALCDKKMHLYLGEMVQDWLFDNGHGKGTKSGLP
jgi:hypothetical protein